MKIIPLLGLLFLCWGCQQDAVSRATNPITLPADLTSFQKQTLAHLTGEHALPWSEDSLRIKSRWSESEKALSRVYLQAVISSMGLEPQIQRYTQPNENPVIDILLEPYHGNNVYAVLPATEPSDEYVVIGAHYDTGAKDVPGAIDNGSGMLVTLSVLREMMREETRRRNIIAVLFDQEEEEVTGSTAFAKYLQAEDYKVHSVHTLDMVGWDSDGNREVELEMPNQYLENLYRRQAEAQGIPVYTTDINTSDHYAFIKLGFSALGISQAYAKRDNSGKKDTPDDKYELVNFPYLRSTTELVLAVFREITQ